MRSFLTALGIVFGVCSVITMLAIGEGASYEAQEQIKDLGSQNIIIQSEKPTSTTTAGEQTRSLILEYGITYRDISQIQSTIPGVEVTVPSRTMKDYVWRLSRSVDGTILGTIPWYPRMKNRDLVDGRFFTRIELDKRENVCVINEGLSREIFPLEDPIGKTLRVRQSYFRVIGIVEDKKKKNSSGDVDLGGVDDAGAVRELLVPITTLNEHFGKVLIKRRSGSFEAEKVELHEAVIRIKDAGQVFPAAQAIRYLMEQNHKDSDYKITVPLDLLQQAERTKQIFNIVLGSIAAISLIVGGIG
ncbi:MAG: ABC transporter permease, partial [Methylococcales bacterium]|nr:ABC transporter permease [Methylococcales bacterium]